MDLLKGIPSLLCLCLALMGCGLSGTTTPPEDEGFPGITHLDFSREWTIPNVTSNGRHLPAVEGDIYYAPDYFNNRISAVDWSTGTLVWISPSIHEINTNPVVVGDRIYVGLDLDPEGAHFACLNKNTGELLGKLRLDSFYDSTGQPIMRVYQNWMVHFNGYLYFYGHPMDLSQDRGIYRIALNQFSVGSTDSPVSVTPERFRHLLPDQVVYGFPYVEQDYIYFMVAGGGWSGPIPPGETHLPPGKYYDQDNVKLAKYDSSGTLIWETGFQHCGDLGPGEPIIDYGERLVVADMRGLAVVQKSDGSLVLERMVQDFSPDGVPLTAGAMFYYGTISGEYLLSTDGYFLNCFDLNTAELLWKHEWKYTRDVKPIVLGTRVYLADPDALWCFNLEDGSLVGVDPNKGIPGDRLQGAPVLRGELLIIPFSHSLDGVILAP